MIATSWRGSLGRSPSLGLLAWCVALSAVACGGAGDRPAGERGDRRNAACVRGAVHSRGGSGVAIDFSSTPDPLEAGDNSIAVTVRQPDGSPVTDASVKAVFSMPPMPAMNMPPMRSEATLEHVGSGRYQGTCELSMGGTWNVAITATRGSEQLGTRRLSIVAKQ